MTRPVIVAAGGLAGLALLVPIGLLTWPHPQKKPQKCLPYFLIPREVVCVKNVWWTNPDGSVVIIGRTGDLVPMPRPPRKP